MRPCKPTAKERAAVERVQRCLVRADDLLTPAYRARARKTPVEGHCATASEVVRELLGPERYALVSMRFSRDGDGLVRRSSGNDLSHWWLVDKRRGCVLDPTAEQFTARERAWLYAHPAARSRALKARGHGLTARGRKLRERL